MAVSERTPKRGCFVPDLPHEMVLKVTAAWIQIFLCGWPNFKN